MLYLFCYVLRVKSVVRNRRQNDGEVDQQKGFFDERFGDVDDFIQRMTLATGLDVKHVQSVGEETARITLKKSENG